MDPVPDHGETSYQGSGKLQGRKALITGGDSGMGLESARYLLREGARIVLTDLASGSAGGLEELFLTLTASESREGIAA